MAVPVATTVPLIDVVMMRGIGPQYGASGSVPASQRFHAATRGARSAMASVLEVLRAYARSEHPLTPACVSEIEDYLANEDLDMRLFSNKIVNEPVLQE